MQTAIHLFVIWNRAESWRTKIIDDLKSKFIIKETYEIKWDFDLFGINLARFYGSKLPTNSPKETRIGRGPFTLVIVEDQNPNLQERRTRANKTEIVNTNIFDCKTKYRQWTKDETSIPDLIHSSNSIKETSRDLTLLLGVNMDEYLNKSDLKKWNGKIKKLSLNIIGAHGWPNINKLLFVLNSTTEYVILRNFESIPEQLNSPKHKDIDFLVSDYEEVRMLLNAKPLTSIPYRVLNEVEINGILTPIDLRNIGDGYYDEQWERSILKSRIWDNKGFYKPNKENYFYSLIYHALIHKTNMSGDYKSKLNLLSEELKINNFNRTALDNFMNINNYSYSVPTDKSVKFVPDIEARQLKKERIENSFILKIFYLFYRRIYHPNKNVPSRLIKTFYHITKRCKTLLQ
tara:strand:+ start:7112 stop:8320 length:1209 start_codon:yes stop_codon:yes gene_type:complete